MPVTSYRWCTGSCMKYRANVSTVKEAPSLRRPGLSHWSPADGGEAGGQRLRRRGRAPPATAARVLGVVAVRERRLVLVPVRVQRVVLGQHQAEPVVVQPEHVAHVAAVLERRPLVRAGAAAPRPRAASGAGQAAALARIIAGTSSRANELVSRPHSGHGRPQHPRPVLRVRNDRHGSTLMPPGCAHRRACCQRRPCCPPACCPRPCCPPALLPAPRLRPRGPARPLPGPRPSPAEDAYRK